MTSLYDFTVSDQADRPVSLQDYKGKVVLIVNTATGCGLTPQYQGLQELYDKYKDQGFEILDFPCNQFMLWDRHLVVLKKSKAFAPSITIQPSHGLPKSRSMVRKQSHFLIGLKKKNLDPLGLELNGTLLSF